MQRPHSEGCAASWPTSSRQCQQRSHLVAVEARTCTASASPAVTLAADAHTSHDKPHATGLQIRLHENETLRNITSFHVSIDAVPAAEIAFT